MTQALHIAGTTPPDQGALETLYRAAFPDEDLLPLVRGLLADHENVQSLGAWREGTLIGHVAFTRCTLADKSAPVALLGPLAVSPALQRQGFGRALLREGTALVAKQGMTHSFVLGDPDYYGRFGFHCEDRVDPPYRLPPEWHGAWQSMSLDPSAGSIHGTLQVPPVWRSSALWSS